MLDANFLERNRPTAKANAIYLLTVNFSLGLAFSLAFVGIAKAQGVALGYWCAAGFLLASATVGLEMLAPRTSMPQLVSFLSFSCLHSALALVAAGIIRNFTGWPLWPLLMLYLAFEVAFPSIVMAIPRHSLFYSFAYQTPVAAMSALGGAALLSGSRSRRSVTEHFLMLVLFLSAAQFLFKGFLSYKLGPGASIQTYVFSSYAQFSQTISAILSILLGVSLMLVVMEESNSRTRQTLLRDHLSGLWTRRPFFRTGRGRAEARGLKRVARSDSMRPRSFQADQRHLWPCSRRRGYPRFCRVSGGRRRGCMRPPGWRGVCGSDAQQQCFARAVPCRNGAGKTP